VVFAVTQQAITQWRSARALLAMHAATQMAALTTTAQEALHAVSRREFAPRQAVPSVLTNINASIVVLEACAAMEGFSILMALQPRTLKPVLRLISAFQVAALRIIPASHSVKPALSVQQHFTVGVIMTA